MGLRGKIAGIFVVGFGAITLFALTQHHSAFQNSFLAIEHKLAESQLRQLTVSLNDELDKLNQASYDWANWDDAYAYLQHPNPGFTERQLSPAVLKNIDVKFLALLDSQGNTVFSEAVDLRNGTPENPVNFAGIMADIKKRLSTIAAGRPCGLALSQGGPMLVCWQAIHKVDGPAESATAAGTLVMARALNSTMIAAIQSETGLKFELTPITSHEPAMPASAAASVKNFGNSIELTQLAADDNHADTLDALIYSLVGEPILKVRVEYPHDISNTGSDLSWKEVLRMSGVALLVGLVLFLCLNFLIFGRLYKMGADLKSIWRNGRWAERLTTDAGVDEISDLAHSVNRMLGLIRKQTQTLDTIAHTDSLTQIANRRAFEQRILIEMSLHKRNHSALSLLLIDIDHFDAYNDRHGHPAGDEILMQIAKLLTQVACRPSDLPARIGEQEFAVVLPTTALDGAIHVAETLNSKLALLQIPHANSPIGEFVTLSIGVTEAGDEDLAALMYRIEQANNQARDSGGNQICALAQGQKTV